MLFTMKTELAAVLFFATVLAAPGTSQPADPKGPAVDTSFLKQYAETRGFSLGRPQKPKVAPDGKSVLFLRADGKTPRQGLFEFDVSSGKSRELLSPEMLVKNAEENLSAEEKARRERQRVSVGGFTDFHFDNTGNRVLLKLSNRLYIFDRAAGSTSELKTGEDGAIVDPKWAPDGKHIAYVRGFDVYSYDVAAGTEAPVTTGGTALKTHGLAEFVAQEEMHRFSGFWWSPDSKHIAYEEADHTRVETWYVADPFYPGVKPTEQFYPRPGKQNVNVKLGVCPANGGETTWIEWDRTTFEYLAIVKWEEYAPLTIQVQDRRQQRLVLLGVDIATGKTRSLVEETDAAWVNLNPGVPRFNGALGGFIWMGADKAGEQEIQLRDWNTGRLSDVLVPAELRPRDVESVYSARFETFLVYSGGTDPTTRLLYRHRTASRNVNPGGPDDLLTPEPGVHIGSFGKHGGPYTLTSTTLKSMPRSTVFNLQGAKLGELASVAEDPPFTPDVQVLKIGEGEGYYAGIVRPRSFDSNKKYPVLVYVYGGPTSQVVTQAMQPWLVRQWLADQGFIVVAIDNRGTAGRGRNWEKSVYKKFGTVPLEDQVNGLKALCKKFPEMDAERVGIVGWSFGGYMAANAVLREPDLFKAAVAGAPVTDWEDYDTHYTERYLGLLPVDQAAYEESSLLPLAKNLTRPLLLVHGTADDNVYFRHTLKLENALFRAGRDFEVLPLPGITHMITSDPHVMERFWSKTATFFQRHLGEPK